MKHPNDRWVVLEDIVAGCAVGLLVIILVLVVVGAVSLLSGCASGPQNPLPDPKLILPSGIIIDPRDAGKKPVEITLYKKDF